MATTQMSLTLAVDKENSVVFAECGNDFVDVLLSFLTMPIGTIIRLTGKESKIGGISTLYKSVGGLDVSLLQTEACKKMLLYPKNASEKHSKNLKVNIDDTETFYNAQRPSGQSMETQSNKAACVASSKDVVFVKGNKTFIIRADLQVFPSDSMKVKQEIRRSGLETKVVNVGAAQEEKGNGSKPDKVSVKLTVNKSNKKVVYAKGGEEFADLLFSFLAFPLGFVAKFFGGDSGIKCLDNLYRSVQVLKKLIESKECEGLLVDPNDPKLGPHFSVKNQPLQIKEQNPWQPTIIGCVCSKVISSNDVKIIDYSSGGCGHVRPKKQLFTINPKYPSPVKELGGSFIAGRAMFLVTDELNVKQHSPELGFSLLEKLSIPRTDLEEHVVTVGEVVGS